jgi:4-amino-4-deoxy-L-arabinose transferase-like glycosyltransferase
MSGDKGPTSSALAFGRNGGGGGPTVERVQLTVGPSLQSFAPSPRERKKCRLALLAVLAFTAVFAAASWRALGRLQFANSIENIVVQTALETRRGGHWLVPRMLDEPRTRKPPLATWLSALSVRPDTLAQLSDTQTREAAYVRLAREMRLPALAAACLTILLTFELGRLIAGPGVGAWSAVMTGTSLLFLESARLATPDAQLMLWATACNVLLARAAFRGQRWIGCCGAGVCLGLALMSKGPVALIQTVVPAGVFVVLAARHELRRWVAPALACVALSLCVSLPWYALMVANVPGVGQTWFDEVTRLNPADPRPDRWYANLQFVRHVLPWTPWFVVGMWTAGRSAWRRQGEAGEMAFWIVVVPLVVMSFFSERKPRYLLPLVPAAAVLAARAMVNMPIGGKRRPVTIGLVVTSLAGGMLIFDAIRTTRAGGSDMKPLADAIALHVMPEARVWSVWPRDPANNAPIDLSIYLNRVVAPAASIDAALDDPACRVVVIEAADTPPPPMPGATYVGSASRGASRWHAFVLPLR